MTRQGDPFPRICRAFCPHFRVLYPFSAHRSPILQLSCLTVANGLLSTDLKTVTFHLRSGVVWSDGQPLDARDVDFTWHTQNAIRKIQCAWSVSASFYWPPWRRLGTTSSIQRWFSLWRCSSIFLGWNGRFDEAEWGLRRGIHASQHLKDRYHQSRFMSRLGAFICYRGKLDQARSIWDECLEIAKSLGQPIYLWYPLANQAFIADTLGDYDSARCLATTFLQRAEEAGEPGVIPDALCRRATYARLQGDRDSAFDDISASLRILTEYDPKTCNDYYYMSSTQAELARVQGDYLRSQQYTEAAISYVQSTKDRINVPDLLFEQARFAQQLGMWDNARMLALRTISFAEQLGAHLFTKRARTLLKQVPDYTH